MPVVPKVIFLYDNDALEVRYSDDSRLELSPCGAAMVFHPPSKPGEHPFHCQSQQVHKRTQFVTSEHRQKVLQALDFRNRFAQRPYLCEELLENTYDIVSLYASVDQAKWPKLQNHAKVDILPDGSRKVTSLDEFASLIVSPHGQDFSVCYLSKVSLENTHRDSPLPPLSMPHQFAKHRTKPLLGIKEGKKASEAIITPYYHEHNEMISNHANHDSTVKTVSDQHAQNHGNFMTAQNCHNQAQQRHVLLTAPAFSNNDRSNTQQPLVVNFEDCVQRSMQNLELGSNVHPHVQSQIQPTTQLQSYQPSTQIPTDMLISHDISHNNRDNGMDQKQNVIDMRCSPVPHEISSISRSSTPDGLRMTIDSDTTLIHDISENEAVRYRQRHSSPTQQSPSSDDPQLPFARLIEMNSSPDAQGSFISFPQSNQLEFPSIPSSHTPSSGSLSPAKQTVIPVGSIFDEPESPSKGKPSDRLQSHSFDGDISASSHNSTLCHSHGSLDVTPTNPTNGVESSTEAITKNRDLSLPAVLDTHDSSFTNRMPFTHQAFGVIQPMQGNASQNSLTCHDSASEMHPSQKGSQHNTASAYHDEVVAEQANELQNPQPHAVEGRHLGGNLHFSIGSTGFNEEKANPVSPIANSYSHSTTSNVDADLEHKSSCKVKYLWTTVHASRNSCPKEWTHPLWLALQGSASTPSGEASVSTGGACKDKDCCITQFPQSLPLTCPFQHTHRSAPSKPNPSGNEESESGSNVGVFERGRVKVILSEGIVYRLIPASGMTVVEIYPGDGSVLISQGAKAFYFTHFIPREGQLEERMFSLKSLPPRCTKEFRPIEKMLKTANRFLHMCLSWDKRNGQKHPPCWQKEIVAVVEPLSSSILEECVIDGLGRFMAYSNGRVRIVFDDRTSLDMMSEFSSRFGSTTKISPKNSSQDETVRLLLPSGNYILVEKNSSGPYRQYLKMANEWIAWVNTSPSERHKFYVKRNEPAILDQAAKLELKKITCFNYILDNTFQPIHQSGSSQNSVNTEAPAPLPLFCNNKQSLPMSSASPRGHCFSKPDTMPDVTHTRLLSNTGSDVPILSMDTTAGFLSVRQALAQTSSLISDIENFLENNKT